MNQPTTGIAQQTTTPEIALMEAILIRRAINQNDEKMEGVGELIKTASGINYYAMQTDYDFNKTWDEIRAKAEVTAMLLDIIHEFIVRMGGITSTQMTDFIEAWAGAMCATVHKEGYMDATLKDRVQMQDVESAKGFLMNNLWLVVLGTIAQTDFPKVVLQVRLANQELARINVR